MVTIQKDQPEERGLTDQDLRVLMGLGEDFGEVAKNRDEGPYKSAANKLAMGCNQSVRDKSSAGILVNIGTLDVDEVQNASDLLHNFVDGTYADNTNIYHELDAVISARARELDVKIVPRPKRPPKRL